MVGKKEIRNTKKDTNKIKPLSPSFREKKRYILFQVVSEKEFDQEDINQEIKEAKDKFFGIYLSSKAGVQIVKNKFDKKSQRGIIRVSRKYVDHMKVALGLITKIKDHDAIVRTIKVSGILKKTEI